MRHIVPVTSRVQGYIKKVCFDEYSYVHKGDTLVIIEDREYRLKLAEAEAELQNAISGKTVMNSAIYTTENNIGVNEASILGTKAELENAERDLQRYAVLLKNKAVTAKQYDDAKTHYERTKAELMVTMLISVMSIWILSISYFRIILTWRIICKNCIAELHSIFALVIRMTISVITVFF